MDKRDITPVILCGGSGSRLWPLSRKSFPKQFIPLIDNKSLLQLTLERVGGISSEVVCTAAEDHRFLINEAMKFANTEGSIILEPVARNTAAAMALAALLADPRELLLFCPADHHIPDSSAFSSMVEQGRESAKAGSIITFGIVPSFPGTSYGYLEKGEKRSDGSWQVARFIEKPNAKRAQDFLLQGNFLWNAGIFLVQAEVLLNTLKEHAPDILHSCQQAMNNATKEDYEGHTFIRPEPTFFASCRDESIDYAVMERCENIAVASFDGAWSDVGSWDAVSNLIDPDVDGNRIDGNGIALHARKTYVHAPHRLVVALGTEEVLIIDTPDALLVAARGSTEQVKEVVSELEKRQSLEAVLHRKVVRPWGWYDSLDRGDCFQVKRITVKPGASLSLQKHRYRAEHWIVVKGVAEVTRGAETFLLKENQSTYIPIGEVHRLRNPRETELEIIEVQSGSYLGEDDIIRLEDSYGRRC